ncbi:DUF4391 domain-containing protein [Aeromonas allosaccharophila]|uniref:DUF4391 domain-containing protein n=1 Tax=Aeromonas allosaccharophila TaxID=656 RepID=UPI003D215299
MINTEKPNTIDQLFTAAFSSGLSLADALYRNMALPEAAFLGTRITKKMLNDSASHNGIALSAQEKQLISDGIQSIEWRYTLKPDTVNIAAWVTDQLDYVEVALLHVRLKPQPTASDNQQHTSFTKLATLLHKLIPYPLLVVAEQGEAVALSLADKRINQADKTKWVVEQVYHTPWFSPHHLSGEQQVFLLDFSLKNAATLHYYALYQDLIAMLIALQTSGISGRYLAKNQALQQVQAVAHSAQPSLGASVADQSNSEKVALLKQLASLEAQLNAIRNKLKKETQMNIKMQLNVEARQLKLTMADIKAQL